jgi:NDP-sugar pyrophosphorylase family protein
VLLDTAGGLKNIEDLLDEDDGTILVYNGDVVSDLPLERLLDAHFRSRPEATLVLRSSGGLRNVSVDGEGRICDMRGILGNPGTHQCLFTGIYVVQRAFLDRLEAGRIESVVPVLVEMIRCRPGSVGSVVIDEGSWYDIGTIESYSRLDAEFASRGAGAFRK